MENTPTASMAKKDKRIRRPSLTRELGSSTLGNTTNGKAKEMGNQNTKHGKLHHMAAMVLEKNQNRQEMQKNGLSYGGKTNNTKTNGETVQPVCKMLSATCPKLTFKIWNGFWIKRICADMYLCTTEWKEHATISRKEQCRGRLCG